ncbi:Serine/threonine-protein phosphatase 6 catalytic subunit, partial [Fragariocoptes setiger]
MDFCDFLAEDELVEIVPNFRYNQVLNLICGDFGPFQPSIPIRVPMWMALNLHRQQKCKIILPLWIRDLHKYSEQQANDPGLIEMPSDHWREILKLLETHNISIPHNSCDLVERREAILRKSVHTLMDQIVSEDEDRILNVKLKNATRFELAYLKKLLLASFETSKSLAGTLIIDDRILCVHGGLSPHIALLDQIRTLERNQEIPYKGPFCDLVWSDPEEVDKWTVSPRGAGWLFGAEVTQEFMHLNQLKLICRAHQLVNEGYKYMFDKKIVTIWSAPNYCYRCGNIAAVMSFEAKKRIAKLFHAVCDTKRIIPEKNPAPYFL